MDQLEAAGSQPRPATLEVITHVRVSRHRIHRRERRRLGGASAQASPCQTIQVIMIAVRRDG
jgi:hypothetical protein